MRLLADRMLSKLAKRLRLVGYDCALVSEGDSVGLGLLKRARAEGRVFVTAASGIAREAPEIVLVPPTGLPEQVREIVSRFPIDFRRLAFTRCGECNVLLADVPFADVAGRLPEQVRAQRPDPLRHCPSCDRLYWPGTHVRRVVADFAAWTGITLLADREDDLLH